MIKTNTTYGTVIKIGHKLWSFWHPNFRRRRRRRRIEAKRKKKKEEEEEEGGRRRRRRRRSRRKDSSIDKFLRSFGFPSRWGSSESSLAT
jgi:hypothetical protein